MIIVTGGFGFIGSNIVKTLNNKNIFDIAVVDKKKSSSFTNLKFKKFFTLKSFQKKLKSKSFLNKIEVIFHQGANSSTVGKNIHGYINNNFLFTKNLIDKSLENNIKLIYASSASVYGLKKNEFKENLLPLSPANNYGLSKALVDYYLIDVLKNNNKAPIVGLRYFNVYGPNEFKKKRMASVIYNLTQQILRKNQIKLAKGSDGFKDGEQKRDFVHVQDCVDINLWFWKKKINGIFNVGTGSAVSFNQVANEVKKNLKCKNIKTKYISIPKDIINKYQSYTKANISKLRKVGYKKKLINYKRGIKSYLSSMNNI